MLCLFLRFSFIYLRISDLVLSSYSNLKIGVSVCVCVCVCVCVRVYTEAINSETIKSNL